MNAHSWKRSSSGLHFLLALLAGAISLVYAPPLHISAANNDSQASTTVVSPVTVNTNQSWFGTVVQNTSKSMLQAPVGSTTASVSNTGFYSIRDGHVFCNDTNLTGADPMTFVRVFSVPDYEDAGVSSLYNVAKDKNHVYSECTVLAGASPSTFQMIFMANGQWANAAKDAEHVYYASAGGMDGSASLDLFASANSLTFQVFGDFIYGYSKDKHSVWKFDQVAQDPVVLQSADPASFHPLAGQNSPYEFDWGADKNHVYYDGRIIDQADPTTFSLLCSSKNPSDDGINQCLYAKDNAHVYVLTGLNGSQNMTVLAGADPETFVLSRL